MKQAIKALRIQAIILCRFINTSDPFHSVTMLLHAHIQTSKLCAHVSLRVHVAIALLMVT